MFDFLRILISFFDRNGIDYMLSGSVAMSTYTVPRFTRDFDFVVHLKEQDIPILVASFRDGYYCDEDAVTEAVKHKGMFNIIDHKSGYKADFIILKNQPFRQAEFKRKRNIQFLDMSIQIVSPEDLLISKIIWIQDIQSAVQAEDIKTIYELDGLDRAYIKDWIDKLELNTFGLLNE